MELRLRKVSFVDKVIPYEILYYIVGYLELKDKIMIGCTCRKLNDHIIKRLCYWDNCSRNSLLFLNVKKEPFCYIHEQIIINERICSKCKDKKTLKREYLYCYTCFYAMSANDKKNAYNKMRKYKMKKLEFEN